MLCRVCCVLAFGAGGWFCAVLFLESVECEGVAGARFCVASGWFELTSRLPVFCAGCFWGWPPPDVHALGSTQCR